MRRLDDVDVAGTIGGSFADAAKPPKKPKKHPSPITLRLTDEEREKLKRLSSSMSVSGYIRK